MPLVQEVDAKVKELRQTIAGLNNKQMSLRTTLKKSKEKTAEMDTEVCLLSDMIEHNIISWRLSRMSYRILTLYVMGFWIVYGRNIGLYVNN